MRLHSTTAIRRHAAALRILLILTLLTGIAYPLVVTGIAQLCFPFQANGSLLRRSGQVIGSELLGQHFTTPTGAPDRAWFQPRPSTGHYNALSSGASNLGPNNATLLETVRQRRSQIALLDGVPPAAVPADATTASGSGLDPHISPAYAYQQVNRIAHARRLPPVQVKALVASHIEQRYAGFLGEQRVNVVKLNAALSSLRGP
ncbi:potassium-transporting ATPase subunit KdpC [Streptomyces sp. NPDC127084]|uniref:potassium-transporting ATPase subunit KdpC n=1 Tax=Streptomyces sp. NPDC127084 TaxID=3347133 RepID=UPI00365E70DB